MKQDKIGGLVSIAVGLIHDKNGNDGLLTVLLDADALEFCLALERSL